jgi:hypothetical protein
MLCGAYRDVAFTGDPEFYPDDIVKGHQRIFILLASTISRLWRSQSEVGSIKSFSNHLGDLCWRAKD